MTVLSQDRVITALKGWTEPYLGLDLVTAQAVRNVSIEGGTLVVELELGFPLGGYAQELAAEVRRLLSAVAGVQKVEVKVSSRILSHAVQRNLTPLPGVKNIIAVASGKGGVGKSTVAVNLALALTSDGARVGILDADIYGPSQPRMLGVAGKRPTSEDGKIIEPIAAFGMKVMSIGFMMNEEDPVVWRGPMVMGALEQMMRDVRWGEIDVMVVDMPPGTGDTQLTMTQRVPLSGAVIVSTPQDIALIDARKGLAMFKKVNVPILGIIENMSTYICPNCGHEEHIFGHGGARLEATRLACEFLGELPLDIAIRTTSDAGTPIVVSQPKGKHAEAYRRIAERVWEKLQEADQPRG